MHDPFPIPPPPLLVKFTTPLANALALPTLPFHIHEIILATLSYHLICTFVSPYVSSWLFPNIYPKFNARTRLNWDVHVVSLVQSVVICTLALYVMLNDAERWTMEWEGRVFGYTAAGGMIQGLAAGYFLWDLAICAFNVSVFGWGLLAHAIAALAVFSLGFVSGTLLSMPTALHGVLGGVIRDANVQSRDPSSTSTARPSSSTSSPPPSSTSTGSSTSCT